MSNVTATATVRKAFGKLLSEYGPDVPPVLEVPFTFDSLVVGDTIPDDEVLTEEDIIGVINSRRSAAARAAAVNKTLETYGIKAPQLSDAEKGYNNIVKGLVLSGIPEADARQMADTMLAGRK